MSHDVAIIGAGIAGLAASVLLRNAGLRVVCLDHRQYPQRKVGELDERLFTHCCALDTEFIWDRVTDIHTDGDRITGCSTLSGGRVDARWFIDASGTARYRAILAAGAGERISPHRRRRYSQHVIRLGHSFNAHIEQAIY